MESKVTDVQSASGITIAQIATSEQDTFNYIACGGGLASKSLVIREMSDGGSVNMLVVENRSDNFVFLMDGDILAGAKQNRILNTSILLAPQSTTKIPVSCVEQGRWSRGGGSFGGVNYTAPASFRMEKAEQVGRRLKREGCFASDQSRIWERVEELQASMHVNSPTSSLSDIFDGKGRAFRDIASQFTPHEHANGLALFIGASFAGLDVFNRRDVYREYFPKLLHGAAFEAEANGTSRSPMGGAEAKFRTLELLDGIGREKFDESPSVGVGTDRRFSAGAMNGFELVYAGHSIHLAAFARAARS